MSDFPADQVENAATAEHGDTGTQHADAAQWAAAPAQHRRRLPWASLHTLLVQGGFPGIFPALADSRASAPADYSDLEPANEDLFQALHSLLEELARAAAHAKRLTEALQAAQRQEAAVVAGFTSAAKRREAEVAKWKRLALDNQLAARDAQLSSRHSGQAGDAASAEARRLEGQVQQLEHQLRSKVGGDKATNLVWPCKCCLSGWERGGRAQVGGSHLRCREEQTWRVLLLPWL